LIAFASSPEDVVDAAELFRDVDRLLHLRGRIGEGIGVGARRGAVHVARVRKEVRGSPEEADSRALLLLLESLDDAIEIAIRLGERGSFGSDIAVVEAIERRAELLHELEGDAHAAK